MRLIIFVFGTVSCLIGVSFTKVNLACETTTACNTTKNETCDNGICKIKIEGTCTVDQTPTTAAHPTAAGSKVSTTSVTGPKHTTKSPPPTTATPKPTTTTTIPTTTTTIPTTTTTNSRKRRDARTPECVENSLCTKTASSNDLTCQCRDGYTKDENGLCQHKSSASSLRKGFFASVVVALLMFFRL